jgi:N-formylglutamate deformylase
MTWRRETCDGIQRLATHLGAPGKFHWTLTEALVRIMAARGAADRTRSFDAFLIANPDLMTDARGLVLRHYSEARLAGADAKRSFVPPDLAPL